MDAIVLAGGFGTRLRQVVPDFPKPMAPWGAALFGDSLDSTGEKRVSPRGAFAGLSR